MFCAALGEGAIADWSALYLREVVAAADASSAMGFAVFSATMFLMRLAADPLVARFGVAVVGACLDSLPRSVL